MEKVLFLTNKLFIDEKHPEGGVRLCTLDFIKLLRVKYDVVLFPVEFNRSLMFRLKARFGIDVFEDFKTEDYKDLLVNAIRKDDIQKVFINLTSSTPFAKVIKDEFVDSVKVILCSHGNESGDFLHHSVRFKKLLPWVRQKTSAWRLGKLLQKELYFRIYYVDLVLTVSEVEHSIEQWLGAKQVIYVPRIFEPDYIEWNPVAGRIGFIGDVSHHPNYYGLLSLCEVISKKHISNPVELRIVGKPCDKLDDLLNKYSFIFHTGYLDKKALEEEVTTWMYFLNPVFYYSKGVSTKLAKGMNWGLPVISTVAGNRGYIFKRGGVITCSNPNEMAKEITDRAFNCDIAKADREQVMHAVDSYKDFSELMKDIYPVIHSL